MSSLPSVNRYLAQLPDGMLSYPEARAKGTVVLPYLQGEVGRALRANPDLPAPLRALFDDPPTVSAWISEVVLAVLILAALDGHFAHAGGADALQAYIRETNRAALTGPAYRVLFAVASPERLLAGAAQRWSAFHRGSSLRLAERESGRALLDLTHPPGIFSDHSFRGHGTTFALAAELAGGRDVKMSYAHEASGLTRYTVLWH
jgi:hypothetical protein